MVGILVMRGDDFEMGGVDTPLRNMFKKLEIQ